RFRASPASVALLKEVTGADANRTSLVEQLQRLVAQRPRERSLRFALADVLRGEGRLPEARALLRDAGAARPGDPEVVRRLYELERNGATPLAASHFLVEWSARYPDTVHLLGDHWDDLLRQGGPGRVGLRELRALAPPADAPPRWEAAKEFWVAHVARLRHRRDVARAALRRSAEARPVFEPALRAWAGWDREELGMTAAERDSAVGQYADALGREGDDAAMAEELRGMRRLSARDFAGARERLARAVELSGTSPERQFALAVAARGAGDEAAFERVMWKLISDWPGFEDAYSALYALYEGRDAEAQSAKVVATWLAADPASVPARLAQVREQLRGGRVTAAQGLVQRLFADRPGDPRVLALLRAIYGQGERALAWLVTELQQRHAKHPGDLAAAVMLVDVLADEGRAAEATRVLDATRAAAGDDPDLLYQVAHLYERVGQKATTERVLRDVLAREPRHAPAANDLGYSLAEEGRELARAEALARAAVEAEPGNPSFLDSLGWVLYKRGKLAEARAHLEKSAETAAAGGEEGDAEGGEGADPVVLDHLVDTVYRQGDAAAAGVHWGQAARRLAEMPASQRDRDDLKQLRLQLDRKRKQLEAGQPVSTAPLAEGAGSVLSR
ncbi:MAG TPA: tetratricopeptide repeat protein, partial [Longimicrobium sp.]|nr:tetratricopeptide repeat protein [Longimicrobium sp.]